MKRTKSTFLLVGILLGALFFRFFKLSQWVHFGMDQEYQAFIVKNIVTGSHFPLIGVSVSDTGLYLGPLFSYFASIPFALTNGDPLGWAIVASLIGVFVCGLIYFVGWRMISKEVGLFAALFYGMSFLVSFYDRQFWNPSIVPLISLLLGYHIFKLLKYQQKSLLWIAILLGISTHFHFSLLLFIPLAFFAFVKARKHISKRLLIKSIVILLLLQLPQIAFDLRHNFINTKALFHTVAGKNQSVESTTITLRTRSFLSTLGRFIWVPAAPDLFIESGQCRNLSTFRKNAYPEGIAIMIAVIAILYIWIKQRNIKIISQKHKNFINTQAAKFVLTGVIFMTLVYVVFYHRQFFEYYFLYLFPWLAIIMGVSTNYLWRDIHGRAIIFPMIFFFIAANFITIITSYTNYSYTDKIKAIQFAKPYISAHSYSLDALGECGRWGGYRYLFDHFATTPSLSYMDTYFSWLYPKKNAIEKIDRLVVLSLIDHRDRQDMLTMWQQTKLQYLSDYTIIDRKQFGNIDVIILSTRPLTI